jgi:CheY-specific phosphatase CheX
MYENEQNGYLKANTIIFAQNVAQSLADMVGAEFSLRKDTLREKPFSTSYGMIASIHFFGSIQGEYFLCLNDAVALRLIDSYDPSMPPEKVRELRETYSGFIKELLNLSVGISIVELEKSLGDLTFTPAQVIYGELETAKIPSGNIEIEGIAGKMQCGFSVNLANVKIGQKLEDALKDLEKKTSEVRDGQRNIAHILQALPIGLLFIDASGTILPGYSKVTPAVVGLPEEETITGRAFAEVVGISDAREPEWRTWLSLAFEKYEEIPFKDLKDLYGPNEIRTIRDRVLTLNWSPIVDEGETCLKKLLVVIDDVTKQREL